MKNIIVILLAVMVSQAANAQTETRTTNYNLEGDVGIQGYDPVAYFTENKAIEGKESISWTYQGIPYYFASAGNLEKFKADPDKYEPAYGGWCAFAMGATGDKVKVDPETFKIVDGRLNLFYNFFFNNTLKDWNKDEAALMAKADDNWADIIKE